MKESLEKSLLYDPLLGDEGERRILSNKIVKAKKKHDCILCHGQIQAGEFYRALTDVFDGELATYKYCSECCRLMIRVDEGDEAAYDEFCKLFSDI